ncbi:signal transduction histidine kinase [Paenibacillus shirakamiensis]|uniref:histidine kinase n=1 Tax=Paenibacillus shirakamiensis TaxID=1265935 RepID=A0ABS4JFE8_9BACL|nr:HAMP domain-containing sensor histidine kinase [Paenibacillus shirakamiensis]MBP2000436.1 signal transduction histidine kinase [Paenibacillus shirakamiensis]
MRTLRGRVLFSLIAGMFITVAITVFLFVRLIHSLTIDQAKSELHGQIGKAIEILNEDLHALDPTDLKLHFKNRLYNVDYFIINSDQVVVAASHPSKMGYRLHVPLIKEDGIMPLDNKKMLYATRKLTTDNLQIVVYAPLSSLSAITGQLMLTTMVSILASFLVVLVIGLMAVWKTTKPLKELTQAVSSYEPYRPQHPLPKGDRTEIGELINTFQDMSSRIHKQHHSQVEFLQNVSHELRTPLMSIQGYALAIKDQVVTVDQGLEVIHKESKRMILMVEKLLQLSRLEHPGESWPYTTEDMRNMADQAAALLAPAASEYDIGLEVIGDVVVANIPAEQCFQVLINLIQNAIRHAHSRVLLRVEEGEVLSSTEDQQSLKLWAIHIEDDGPGVPPEEAQAIFERFYKGQDGVTGLGLAICGQIAERMGATLSCTRSTLGGARFTFMMKLQDK